MLLKDLIWNNVSAILGQTQRVISTWTQKPKPK